MKNYTKTYKSISECQCQHNIAYMRQRQQYVSCLEIHDNETALHSVHQQEAELSLTSRAKLEQASRYFSTTAQVLVLYV